MPKAGTLSKLASFPDSRLRILNAENALLTMMVSLDRVLAHYGDILTPTRIVEMLLHEMIHGLGIKREVSAMGLHKTEFIAELRKLYQLGAGKWADRDTNWYKHLLENPELDEKVYEKWWKSVQDFRGGTYLNA